MAFIRANQGDSPNTNSNTTIKRTGFMRGAAKTGPELQPGSFSLKNKANQALQNSNVMLDQAFERIKHPEELAKMRKNDIYVESEKHPVLFALKHMEDVPDKNLGVENDISDIGGYKFGSNLYEIDKKDKLPVKALKHVGNFIASIPNNISSTFGLITEGLRQADIQGVNVAQGKGLQKYHQTSFTKDIMPKDWANSLDKFEQKHPNIGGITRMTLETAADPTTYVGAGGVLSEAGKAKMLENTTQGLKNTAELNQGVIKGLDKVNPAAEDASKAKEGLNQAQNIEHPALDLQTFSGDSSVTKNPSQFRTNTIERSTMIPDEVRNKLTPEEFDYIPESKKEWQDNAINNITKNRDKVIRDIYDSTSINGGVQAHEAAIISSQLLDEANSINSYAKFKSFLKTVAEKTRETARALKGTDTAWDKKTPEGALLDAQRVVDQVENDVKKVDPNKIKRIEDQTKQVTDTISQAHEEAAQQVATEVQGKISPEQKLANKVGSTLKTSAPKNNLVDDMVNELFKSAKEAPLPEKDLIKRNPVDFLKQAIENKGQYADVWDKAKTLVKNKYANDPEALAVLDDYFNKGIVPTYSNSTLTRSMQTGMKDLGQTLVDIAKSSKGDKQQALNNLTDYLTKATGSGGQDATQLAQNVQDRFEQLVKEKSQSLLNQKFKEITKKGQKSLYEKVMELVNLGAYDDNSIRDAIKQKEGLPVLDDSDIKAITENMNEAQKQTPGSYDQRMYQARAMQIISDKIPANMRQKFKGLQRISLILNPKTLLTRNPMGNVILGVGENIKDIPGSLIDRAVSLGTGERTTTGLGVGKLKAQAEGLIHGGKEWALDIKNGVDTNLTRGQLELPSGRTFDNPVLNAIDQFERKALQLGDRPFYEAAYNSRIAELKKLGKPIDEAAEAEARFYALDRVFQNDSVLSQKAKQLKESLGVIGDIVVPFTQTPANVFDKLIDYTPGGLAKGLYHLGTTAGKGTFNQKLFVDRLARSLTGSTIGVLGYVAAQKGILSGGASNNAKVRGVEQALGKNPYALKFGDHYFTIDWAQPIAGLLAAGADAYNAGKDKKDIISSLSAGAEGAANTMFKQSFLQGLTQMMSGYSPAAGIAKTLLGSTTQATPTVTSNVAKELDPYVRETYDSNPIKQAGNKMLARIPGASMLLPKKVDVFGNEVKQQQGADPVTKAFNLFINPGTVTEFKPDETQKELLRLYTQSGAKEQMPSIAEHSIDYTPVGATEKQTIQLTPKEYEEYAKDLGQSTMQMYGEIMKDPGYKMIPDKDKANILNNIMNKIKNQVQLKILIQRGLVK